MTKRYVWVLIFLPVFLPAQAPLSVDEVIDLGLQHNFDIRIARNQAEIAAKESGKGKAGFLPVIDAGGNYQYIRSSQETNSPFSFGESTTDGLSGQLTLQWTLFDGFRMFINKERLEANARFVSANTRAQIEQTVVSILRAYYNLVQQELLMRVARQSLQISEQRLQKADIREELGGTSATDYYNARVAFNNDREALLQQELNVIRAQKDLNVLLGRNPEKTIEVQNHIEIPQLKLSQADLDSMSRLYNSEIKAVNQAQYLAERGVRLARSVFYPRLNLRAEYGYSDRTVNSESERFTEPISTQSSDASVALNLSFNLFDGFRQSIDYQNARIELRNKKLALQHTRNRIKSEVQKNYEAFRSQMKRVVIQEDNVEAARQNMELQQDRHAIGTASSLEFRDAQVNYARAQASLINARYQARILRLELERLMGRIDIR